VPVGKVTHKLKVGGNSQFEIFDYPGGYAQRFDGIDSGGGERPAELQRIYEDNQRTAVIRMQQEAVSGLVIRGAGYCRQFVSGHKFGLTRHFDADGQYLITGVEHSARLGGDFRSGDGVAVAYQNRFTCIPLALPYRPPRVTPRPKVEGTQTAIVVGPPGPEEIYTDKYGRVKVQFHWDRQGKYNPDSSCWIRVSTFWAGKQWGAIHLPRRGQEVIVDFLEGDPDNPVIIGSVYNAEMMPPYPLPDKRKLSGVVTRSNQDAGGGSNREVVDDTSGAEKMVKQAYGDHSVEVGDDNTVTVHGNETYTIDGDQTFSVRGQAITVNDFQTLDVKAARTVTVKDNEWKTVGGLCRVQAPKIWLNATTEVVIDCGANRIRIDSAGISINGQVVRSHADALHEITGYPVSLNP
jgi:type VI secretion system secreted protein VgrG